MNLTRTLKELHIQRKMLQKTLSRLDTAIIALRGVDGSSRIFRATVRPKPKMSASLASGSVKLKKHDGRQAG